VAITHQNFISLTVARRYQNSPCAKFSFCTTRSNEPGAEDKIYLCGWIKRGMKGSDAISRESCKTRRLFHCGHRSNPISYFNEAALCAELQPISLD